MFRLDLVRGIGFVVRRSLAPSMYMLARAEQAIRDHVETMLHLIEKKLLVSFYIPLSSSLHKLFSLVIWYPPRRRYTRISFVDPLCSANLSAEDVLDCDISVLWESNVDILTGDGGKLFWDRCV